MPSLRSFFLPVLIASSFATAGSAFALDPINSTGPGHLAVRGTDTTSYFSKGAPTRGTVSHTVRWNGATWRFVSKKEASAFQANPEAYAPQFGAYCTGGLAQRHVVEGKPHHWRLYKGKLYLFHTSRGANRFSNDPVGIIKKAKAYWRDLGMK